MTPAGNAKITMCCLVFCNLPAKASLTFPTMGILTTMHVLPHKLLSPSSLLQTQGISCQGHSRFKRKHQRLTVTHGAVLAPQVYFLASSTVDLPRGCTLPSRTLSPCVQEWSASRKQTKQCRLFGPCTDRLQDRQRVNIWSQHETNTRTSTWKRYLS